MLYFVTQWNCLRVADVEEDGDACVVVASDEVVPAVSLDSVRAICTDGTVIIVERTAEKQRGHGVGAVV